MTKLNGKAKWIGLALTASIIFATIITSHARSQASITAVDVKVKTIKLEGCLPARATDKSISVIQTEIKGIRVDLKELKITQIRHYEAIMKKLNKEPPE